MILLGADPLSRFLNRAAATKFDWGGLPGVIDCLSWLGDWFNEERGFDPAAPWRGTYTTMLGAARIVKEAGGMVPLVESAVRHFGVERTSLAARGHIAVVQIAGDGGGLFDNQAGAIILGGTAALICQSGLICPRIEDAPPVAIWGV